MRQYSARLTRPADVIEAAYDMRGPLTQWLDGLIRASGRDIDTGLGSYAFVSLIEPDRFVLASPLVAQEVDPEFLAAVTHINQHATPPPIHQWMLSNLAVFGTLRGKFGGPNGDAVKGMRQVFPWLRDSIGGIVQSGEHAMVSIMAASRQPVHVDPRVERSWRKVLFHVGTALRLRRRLEATPTEPSALLSSAGTVAHAEGDARSKDARTALVEAVRRIERARAPRVRTSAQQVLELWQGLVHGRWSLVEHFESDGKRYLAAHANEPKLDDPRGLTGNERACLHYFLRGATTAEIAYTLGISDASVGKALSTVSRRLGFPSRAALRRLGEAEVLDRLVVETGGERIDVLVIPNITIHPKWRERLADAELAVASLAAEGRTDQEIAAARSVSVRTVNNQLRAVYRKLGIDDRANLGRRLARA